MDYSKPGVYVIENTINKRIYIGSTKKSIKERLNRHRCDLKNNKHVSKLLQEDINKYGIENFTFKVLENLEDEKQIRKTEYYWIKIIKPEYNSKGVITTVVDYTPSLRTKMSRSHGGKSFEVYDLNGNYVKTFYSQHRCAEELKLNQSNIWNCLKGNSDTIKGYRFKYVGEDFKFVKSNYVRQFPKDLNKGRIPTKEQIEKRKISIAKFHKNNPGAFKLTKEQSIQVARKKFNAILEVYVEGILIDSFLSVKEASSSLKIKQSCISCRINKPRIRNTKYKYVFVKKELNNA